ncbi:hypothetical protein [Flavobacterium silvaticum]|uniref:Uncharacterized protein n=1 Tax=Flavobacterium silvaticum TaxID=1852020 RepID=A0A972FTQ9_9FLAO|nr:hypothetical protein [Flavobacterium silvaticum]NMH27832.1 hypothetical protein [Flavobacterium silvaticum]
MKRILGILFLLILLSGCETAIDCATSDPPEIEERELPDGTLFNGYSATIEVYGNSDFAWQDFRVEGTLPNGLDCHSFGDDIFISGTPTLLGDFEFTIKIKVKHDDEERNGCEYTISRNFRIHIS